MDDRVWVFFNKRSSFGLSPKIGERKKIFNTIFTVDNLRYPKNGPRFYVFFLNFFPCMKKKIPKTRKYIDKYKVQYLNTKRIGLSCYQFLLAFFSFFPILYLSYFLFICVSFSVSFFQPISLFFA